MDENSAALALLTLQQSTTPTNGLAPLLQHTQQHSNSLYRVYHPILPKPHSARPIRRETSIQLSIRLTTRHIHRLEERLSKIQRGLIQQHKSYALQTQKTQYQRQQRDITLNQTDVLENIYPNTRNNHSAKRPWTVEEMVYRRRQQREYGRTYNDRRRKEKYELQVHLAQLEIAEITSRIKKEKSKLLSLHNQQLSADYTPFDTLILPRNHELNFN